MEPNEIMKLEGTVDNSGKSKEINFVISLQGFPRENIFRKMVWRKIFNDSKDVFAESEGLMKKVIKMINKKLRKHLMLLILKICIMKIIS